MKNTDKSNKPQSIAHCMFTNCPAEMQALKQWVMWKYIWRDDDTPEGGSWTKVPFQANGNPASSTDPETWTDFKSAVIAWNQRRGYWDGIGFVFTRECGIVGIDVDNAIKWVQSNDHESELPIYDKWINGVLTVIGDTYAELSPSRTGAHLYVKAKLAQAVKYDGGGIEIYCESRYFTFTGDVITDCNIVAEAQEGLDKIVNGLLAKRAEKQTQKNESQPPATSHQPPTATHLTIEELLRVAFAASNGAEIKRLFDGGWEGTYQSRSEADMALARYLAFYCGGHPLVLTQMMERSALARQKWNKRATSGGATNLSLVIDKVLASERNYFEPARSFFNSNGTKSSDASEADRRSRRYSLKDLGPLALAYRKDPNTRGMECGGPFDEMDEIYRPRRKLVTITVGAPGAGKTTFWLNYLRQFAIKHSLHVGISSFESDPNELTHTLVQAHIQKPTFPDEDGCCTEAEFLQALNELAPYFTIYDPRWEERNITSLSAFWDDTIKEGRLDCIYLDPFTELQPPERLMGKYNEFAQQELARFFDYTKSRSLMSWLICHPTKNWNRKEGLQLWNINGSKDFETKADFGVVLERKEGKLIVSMRKVRVWRTGDVGEQRAFYYNQRKGLFLPTSCNLERGFNGKRY